VKPRRFRGQTQERAARYCRAAVVAALIVANSTAPCPAQTGGVQRFDLRIENGRLAESRNVIAVKRHDRVEISWRADRRTILHLHGYNIEIAAGPDKPETMSFVARATGRFPIETHAGDGKAGQHSVLIYLEVHPR
jgi:hypothetical protein